MTAININHYLPPFTLKKELTALSAAIVLFLVFPAFVRFFDQTAAPIDPGILSGIILSILTLLTFKALTWWLIKTIWPVLATYSQNQFPYDFQLIQPWQKILFFLGFYLLLLFSFVFTLTAVL